MSIATNSSRLLSYFHKLKAAYADYFSEMMTKYNSAKNSNLTPFEFDINGSPSNQVWCLAYQDFLDIVRTTYVVEVQTLHDNDSDSETEDEYPLFRIQAQKK